MIGFEHYSKIKNNYCVCYFGPSEEYLVQMKMLIPCIEQAFPGLNLYLGCKDESCHRLEGLERILRLSELKIRKKDFAHIKELKFDGSNHPVLGLLESSNVSPWAPPNSPPEHTTKCLIVTKGHYPTRSLMEREINVLKRVAKERGYCPEIDTNIVNAGIVMGVESPELFEAAYLGIRTILVPTGVGTPLYKLLASQGEILEIGA